MYRINLNCIMVVGALAVFAASLTAITIDYANAQDASKAAPQDEVSTADIRFTDDMWDADALSFLAIEPIYLPKDLHFEIPPYPHNDSDETKAELEILRQYAETERTPEVLALIESEARGIQSDLEFGLGNEVALSIMEGVDNLRYETLREFDYVLYNAKMSFKRPRPSQLDSMLSTVIAVPGHAAYPSGHAGEFMIVARVFGYIDPANEGTYQAIARDVGLRREIAGVHFPSDTKAGQELAEKVFAALLENRDYRTKIDSLRDEYASVSKEGGQ